MTLRGLWLAAGLAALVFVALASGAAPGPPAPPSGATLALLSRAPTRLALASDRIYSVVTDRYANGEPADDTGGSTGHQAGTRPHPTDARSLHSGRPGGPRRS